MTGLLLSPAPPRALDREDGAQHSGLWPCTHSAFLLLPCATCCKLSCRAHTTVWGDSVGCTRVKREPLVKHAPVTVGHMGSICPRPFSGVCIGGPRPLVSFFTGMYVGGVCTCARLRGPQWPRNCQLYKTDWTVRPCLKKPKQEKAKIFHHRDTQSILCS